MKKSYERREKVAKAIQRELGAIISSGGIKDDRMEQFVSIVDVDLNSSLSSAKVIYSILSNSEGDEMMINAGTQAALTDNAGQLRGVIARKLNLKYAPKLIFIASDSLSKSVDMVHLIDQTIEKDEENQSYRDDG